MKKNMKAASTDSSRQIKDCQAKISDAIFTELNRQKNSPYFKPLRTALKGGKRLRPLLLVLTFHAVSGKDADPLPAAVAVELAHIASLIHDDIFDKDLVRRRAPSFYSLHGYEMAILSADFVLSMILSIVSRYRNPVVAETLAKATALMSEGELEEVVIYRKKDSISTEKYLDLVSKKTASIFEASASLGATIGKARDIEVKACSEFGKLLGIAYQIQDDLTDLEKKPFDVLSLVDVDPTTQSWFEEAAESHIAEAKKNLEIMRENRAKHLLVELADLVASNRTNLI